MPDVALRRVDGAVGVAAIRKNTAHLVRILGAARPFRDDAAQSGFRVFQTSLRADLGELRIAEESFWAENQMYTTDASQLDWRPTTDVTVVISSSDPSAGFQATARHTLMTGTECSTYMGRETMSGLPSGEIVCGPATASPPVVGPPTN